MITSSMMGEPEVNQNRPRAPLTSSSADTNDDLANEAILNSEELRQHMVVMERVVTENIYQPKQALYRGLNIIPGMIFECCGRHGIHRIP